MHEMVKGVQLLTKQRGVPPRMRCCLKDLAVELPSGIQLSSGPTHVAPSHVGCQHTSSLLFRACRQGVPIPSYLLALAVGHLESRPLGPISAVWSEPEMVEAGAHEFAGKQGNGTHPGAYTLWFACGSLCS